jgi:hypothetical protein
VERLSQEDAEAVMGVVQQAVSGILQQAAEKLAFPIKVTVACSAGFVAHMSIAYPGAEPVFVPMEGEVATVRFPVTVTCLGKDGGKLVGMIEEPERETQGNA